METKRGDDAASHAPHPAEVPAGQGPGQKGATGRETRKDEAVPVDEMTTDDDGGVS